jgi:peptidoglycan/LPS O-acetylase OafA/YrhL
MKDRTHTGFIPALDGLRGMAIILVLLHHLTTYRPESGVDRWIASIPLIGWVGVDLFFVLSGFLITGILLDARGGQRYFTSFYARRTLRIFPLYYLVLFLALVVLPYFPVMHTVLVGPYDLPPLWPYWLYLTNVSVADRGLVHGMLDVSWSLAVEEQFYLIWAPIIWLCPPRLIGLLCAAVILGEPLARWFALTRGVEPLSIYVLTWFRLDGLATGGLVAWLLRRDLMPALGRWAPAAALLGVAGIIAVSYDSGDSWWWHPRMQQVGFSLIALTAGAMVVMAINRPADSLWVRMLSVRWLRAFGKYSYCLYLIHLPVMRFVREYVFDPRDYGLVGTYPWLGQSLFYTAAIVPAFALAWISWRTFEAPILALKAKFPY